MSAPTLVTFLLLAVLLFWAVGAYNRLMRLKNAVARQFVPHHAELVQRGELLTELLDAVGELRGAPLDGDERVRACCEQLRVCADALGARAPTAAGASALAVGCRVFASVALPLWSDCASDDALQQARATRRLLDALERTQHRIDFTLLAYNQAVHDYNRALSEFPALLLAWATSQAPTAPLPSSAAPALGPGRAPALAG